MLYVFYFAHRICGIALLRMAIIIIAQMSHLMMQRKERVSYAVTICSALFYECCKHLLIIGFDHIAPPTSTI